MKDTKWRGKKELFFKKYKNMSDSYLKVKLISFCDAIVPCL